MTKLGGLIVELLGHMHDRRDISVGKQRYILMHPNTWTDMMSSTKGTEINQVKQRGNGYEIFDCPVIITNQIEGHKIVS